MNIVQNCGSYIYNCFYLTMQHFKNTYLEATFWFHFLDCGFFRKLCALLYLDLYLVQYMLWLINTFLYYIYSLDRKSENIRGSSVYSESSLLAVLLRQEATPARYVNFIWRVRLRLTRFPCFELLAIFGVLWFFKVDFGSSLPRGTVAASSKETLHISPLNAIGPFDRTWSSRVAQSIFLPAAVTVQTEHIKMTAEYLAKAHQLLSGLLDFLQCLRLMCTEETELPDYFCLVERKPDRIGLTFRAILLLVAIE
jgi:hypothetical protein